MLRETLTRNLDRRRLRNTLTLLFIALAIPTAVLITQAYSQLKWESFHQIRIQAEELTGRIDTTLAAQISTAESRNVADFGFLAGDLSAKFVQRSPLAAWPVAQDIKGVIGYFQVDKDGNFSTPLLPPANLTADEVGLNPAEYSQRQNLARGIQEILAQNKLVRDRGMVEGLLEAELEPALALASAPSTPQANDGFVDRSPSPADAGEMTVGRGNADDDRLATATDTSYSQQRFDDLNLSSKKQLEISKDAEPDDTPAQAIDTTQSNAFVSDLPLNVQLQKKSEDFRRQVAEQEPENKERAEKADNRARRQNVLTMDELLESGVRQQIADGERRTITAFESEIDPYEFSLLDSGHLVLFRNVWRNGNRIIQGLVVDQELFVDSTIDSAFRATTLSDLSDLLIGYNDGVMKQLSGNSYRDSTFGSALEMNDTLLYRSRLSAPFDSLELIYTINSLPPGPGATVLAWTTVILAIVFLGGFAALYRLGLGQIRLARQQQDFVSAVSHELKTPLTSIRMYGEMLKEGWADEAKRKQYYEYIHDESERLTRLISNVLQLANISRNEPQFKLARTTVSTLMDQVQSKIANQVERAGAGFEFKLVADDTSSKSSVNVDVDCFTQIIINLVDNAIKFSKNADNKTIMIACDLTDDKQIVFSVRDYGPGIAKDQLKKIFKLFYRTESELTRETVGTGIGLAIVHQLTTAMNGKVDVINRDPGAQFNVLFPLC